jgi:RimJ/RimL family protein N-acetyltransferase
MQGLTLPKSGLRSGHVVLRRFVDGDQKRLVSVSRDPVIERYVLPDVDPTDEERDAWATERLTAPTELAVQFAVCEDGRSDLSGGVSLRFIRHYNSAEAGYWVAPDRRGLGLGSAALAIVADWLFDELGVERLYVLIDLGNDASTAVVKRRGFSREGVLRAHQPARGGRPDLVSWSLLPSDPRPWHPATLT